jgi:hypothetical protein
MNSSIKKLMDGKVDRWQMIYLRILKETYSSMGRLIPGDLAQLPYPEAIDLILKGDAEPVDAIYGELDEKLRYNKRKTSIGY